MNEQEAYKTVIQNRIVNDDQIKRTARTAAPQRVPALRVLKPIGIALAALLIVFGVTMAIPSARAEVFSWFSPASAQEYLAENPEDRDPVPELDAMITAKDLTRTEIKVNYIADEPYWREIGENFSATLGETIYDGNEIHIAIDFDGVSGYPIYEECSPSIPAGSPIWLLLAEKIEPAMVKHFTEDYADTSAYLSGSMEWWNGPDNELIVTLDDGTRLNRGFLWFACRPVDEAFCSAFRDTFGLEHYRSENAEAIKERVWSHFKTNGARAVANVFLPDAENTRFYPDNGKTLADYTDADGSVTLHLRYWVSIDHGEETETKLDVDLGTVTVNLNAYKDLRKRHIELPPEPVVLSGDAVFNGHTFDNQDHFRVTNYTANLDGVTLRVIFPGVVDIFGIHNLKLLLSMPGDWSEEMKQAFARNLSFNIAIDGEDALVNFGGSAERSGGGSYTLTLNITNTIPFDRINSMQSITLTPVIQWLTKVQIMKTLPDGSEAHVKTVSLGPADSFDTAALAPGTPVHFEGELASIPNSAITLKVN